jgi:hypothetical protein
MVAAYPHLHKSILMNDVMPIALIVVGVLAAIVAALIAYSKKQSRAKMAVMRHAYQAVLTENNLSVDQADEFSHRILGLDTRKQVFVAIQHDGDDTPYNIIPLADVTDCRLRKSGMTINTTKKNGSNVTQDHTDGIALAFILRNGTSVDVPVYSERLDGLTERVFMHRTAEKWQQLVKIAIGKTG